ncbi:MAG: hypothetical protein ACD_60C00003G0002 [uncultured bacterium]|nr:MAG: hypothetical protein ACD_60C00003G0002 [uncultured bacterium]
MSLPNIEVIARLNQLADLLEIANDNPLRVSASTICQGEHSC